MPEKKSPHGLDHPLPSEKSFGLVMAGAFCVFGAISWWKRGSINFVWPAIACLFLLAAFLIPKQLRPLNIAWMKFGQLLGKVMTPLVMGIIYYLVVTPIALLMRGLGKDILNEKLDRSASSYWIERLPPGPKGETLKKQF